MLKFVCRRRRRRRRRIYFTVALAFNYNTPFNGA
jgi:hypothetical protein